MSILSLQKQSQNTDFPNLRPSLDLRFALAKKLDPRITFTRGSTGTYFGPDGLMRTAGVNEPRFDHDPVTGQSLGLLVEESRQNLLTYSNDFSNPAWFIGTLLYSSNNVISPDGTQNASTFTANVITASLNYIYQSFTCSASTTYTFSFYVKLGTLPASSYKIAVYNNTASSFIAVDVVPTQTLSTTSWTRVSYTFTTPAGCVSARVYPYRNNSFTQNNGTFYLWGAQVEAGSFPTSYIPTTASTVTRSADNAQMLGTNFSSWYNQSEGTIYLETDKLYPGNFDAYRHPYRIDSGSNADQITAYTLPGATTITNYGIINGGRQVNDYQQINIGSNPIRYKLGQSVNAKYFFFTTSTGRVPPQLPSSSAPNTHNLSLATNMSRLFIGSSAGGAYMNSHIARFTYYPIQLTNQQLINLTS